MVIEDVGAPKKPKEIVTRRFMAAPVDRLAAIMADIILLVPITSLFVAPFRRQMEFAYILRDTVGAIEAFGFIFGAAVATVVLYQTIFISRWGGTPGKLILGLRVASVHTGEKPDLRQSTLRAWFWCVGLVFAFLPWLGVLSNIKRRPWHDRIAETEVYVVNPRHGVLAPDHREMSVASGVQSMVLCVLLALTVSASIQIFKTGEDNLLQVGAAGRAHEYLCEPVTEAYQEWMSRDEKKPSRVDVALTLFGADAISENCLETEADYALWTKKEKADAYFAKALAVTDDETAITYTKKICETKGQETLCQLAKLSVPAYDKATVTDLLDDLVKLKPDTFLFSTVFIVRELMNVGRYQEALSLLDRGSTHHQVAYFYSINRAKALWGLSKKDEARLAIRSSFDGLTVGERIQLSRWACEVESVGSCTAEATSSCEILASAVKRAPEELEDKVLALTWVRAEECLAGSKVDYKKMQSLAPGEDLQTLLKALEQEQSGQVATAKKELETLLEKVQPETAIWFEVQTRLVSLANSSELDLIQASWTKAEDKAEAGWSRLGQTLFSRLNSLGRGRDAGHVGTELAARNLSDEDLRKKVTNETAARAPASVEASAEGNYPWEKPSP